MPGHVSQVQEPHEVTIRKMVEWLSGRRILDLRLPVNNYAAATYLRHISEGTTTATESLGSIFISYCMNTYAAGVKPPTMREAAYAHAALALEAVESDSEAVFMDTHFYMIKDAYLVDSIPSMVENGLAFAYLKWGTYEDNATEDDMRKEDYLESHGYKKIGDVCVSTKSDSGNVLLYNGKAYCLADSSACGHNSAAMYAALEEVKYGIRVGILCNRDQDDLSQIEVLRQDTIVEDVVKAIGEKPRNCDMFHSSDDAKKAFLKYYNDVAMLEGTRRYALCDLKHNVDGIGVEYGEWLMQSANPKAEDMGAA